MSIAELEAAALEREHHQRMLTICLTMTAGHVDGYGLLVLGTFVSFLSGNTTMTGVRIGQANLLAALSPAIAVLSIVAGSSVANLITNFPLRCAHCVRPRYRFARHLIGAWTDGMLKTIKIALLSLGIGTVNPPLSQIGLRFFPWRSNSVGILDVFYQGVRSLARYRHDVCAHVVEHCRQSAQKLMWTGRWQAPDWLFSLSLEVK